MVVRARRPGLRDADADARGPQLYDEAIEIAAPGLRERPLRRPHRHRQHQGPQISAKQRDRVLGYIEKGKEEGARVVAGGGRPAQLDKGWFVRAHALRRRRQLDDHRPRGDLRPGARRHPLRRRRRRGAHRQRQPVRPRRLRHLGLDRSGRWRSAVASAPAPSASTAGSPTAPTPRSAATRPAASGARTASRASSSTPRSRPTPSVVPARVAPVRVAFVGAGQIGAPMSERLLAAGHDVTVVRPPGRGARALRPGGRHA